MKVAVRGFCGLALLAAACLAAGCGPTPPEACEDLYSTIDEASARACGTPPGSRYAELERDAQELFGVQGCVDADGIRHADSLYDGCIAYFEAAPTCEAVNRPPNACWRQVLFETR